MKLSVGRLKENVINYLKYKTDNKVWLWKDKYLVLQCIQNLPELHLSDSKNAIAAKFTESSWAQFKKHKLNIHVSQLYDKGLYIDSYDIKLFNVDLNNTLDCEWNIAVQLIIHSFQTVKLERKTSIISNPVWVGKEANVLKMLKRLKHNRYKELVYKWNKRKSTEQAAQRGAIINNSQILQNENTQIDSDNNALNWVMNNAVMNSNQQILCNDTKSNTTLPGVVDMYTLVPSNTLLDSKQTQFSIK